MGARAEMPGRWVLGGPVVRSRMARGACARRRRRARGPESSRRHGRDRGPRNARLRGHGVIGSCSVSSWEVEPQMCALLEGWEIQWQECVPGGCRCVCVCVSVLKSCRCLCVYVYVCLRVVVVLVQWSRKVWWEARGGGREGGKTDYPPLLYCVPIAHYRVGVPGVPRKRRIYYYYQYYLALSLCLPASEVWSVWGARGPPCRPPRNDPDPDVNEKSPPGTQDPIQPQAGPVQKQTKR